MFDLMVIVRAPRAIQLGASNYLPWLEVRLRKALPLERRNPSLTPWIWMLGNIPHSNEGGTKIHGMMT
jgi:hypothetical protein